MNFINYKNYYPINLEVISKITKASNTNEYLIRFYTDTNNYHTWSFDTEQDRNIIYKMIKEHINITTIGEDNK